MLIQPNNIYKGDCLNIMQSMQDDSVDCIITDPPYLMERGGSDRNSDFANRTPNKRISHIIDGFDIDKTFNEFLRICKTPNFLIFRSNKQVSMIMRWFEEKDLVATLLVWHKTNPIPLANAQYLSDVEFIVYVRGNGTTFNADAPLSLKTKVYTSPLTKTKETQYHPTQKLVDHIRRYLLIHTKPNDVVFDPFMGSGTTCIAALREGRKYIGVEIDDSYFDIAQKRINNELKQPMLNFE